MFHGKIQARIVTVYLDDHFVVMSCFSTLFLLKNRYEVSTNQKDIC